MLYSRIVPLIDGYLRLQRGEGNLLGDDELPVHLQLMQDSAPAHAASSTKEDLGERGIAVMYWPPFSPDLNPIEHCWNWMKDYQDRKWGDSQCSLQAERSRILECWEEGVTNQRLEGLLRGMGERCQAVIDANGGPTKY